MNATLNKASDIALFLTTIVSNITIANGYHTDIGLRVYRGRKHGFEKESVPCAVIIEGQDTVSDRGPTEVVLSQDYVIGGYDVCDPDQPNDKAHLIIKDLKKALFQKGKTLDRRVQKLEYEGRDIGPRMDGVAIVFAVVHISIRYAETLADA